MRYALTAPVSYELADGPVRERRRLNAAYLMSLTAENLLRPYLFEAGLWSWNGTAGTTVGATVADGPDRWHWGWEAPTSQLQGHMLGHWLSAASWLRHEDPRIGAAADHVVAQLARCQEANGGEWLAPFGQKHLERIASGRAAWAPQYVVHKLLAGLLDAATVGGSSEALDVLERSARWFHRWTGQFDREHMDEILDVETGGMLEVWAGLYALRGENAHRDLMERYRRGRLFDALLRGEDVLTNKHANTQIPEILGCARAYEATGDHEWRRIVEAFWDLAVTQRGTYVTGGSTSAELWQPKDRQAARLHDVQEHCTVVNLMRLADILYRWTGDTRYAAYWERNQVNGLLGQQHARPGWCRTSFPLARGRTRGGAIRPTTSGVATGLSSRRTRICSAWVSTRTTVVSGSATTDPRTPQWTFRGPAVWTSAWRMTYGPGSSQDNDTQSPVTRASSGSTVLLGRCSAPAVVSSGLP